VRFSAAKYNDNRAVANGDRGIRNPATILEEDENNPTHAVVNMSELLASSAAAYAHKPSLTAETQSNGHSSSSTKTQSELNHSNLMNHAPVAVYGKNKKLNTILNGGVP
jgi:hypothetical protein